MTRWILTGLLMLPLWLQAEEHPACRSLVLTEQLESSEQMRAIATSCQEPLVAELYLNRAHHLNLLHKYTAFESSLFRFGNRDDVSYIDAYRIYIGLAEAFFIPALGEDNPSLALSRLNQIYDQSEEIAELRFRGYGLLADQLEQRQRNYY
ncbi:MAG: hypothetical protein ABW076_08655 [Candidatus Thiodiazotropha sp.]